VQLRYETGLTSEEYVKQKAWEKASLETCPLHPRGGCGLARHTAYERIEPPGTFIARYYCRAGHTTFSLLPDCLASRLSSTLAEVEAVASAVEARRESVEAVAQQLRPDIGLQGAVRWVRRRVVAVTVALLALKGLVPHLLAGVQPTLGSFRAVLGVAPVLPSVREIAGRQVRAVPCPVGLGHRPRRGNTSVKALQQETGPDPP
jgi:hypothetical protein